jgi:acyl carrier protein
MTINTTGVLDTEEMRRFVADVLDLDPAAVTDDAHFVADLGMDSLRALEVLVALEKQYDIKISEEEVKDMTCFEDVRELVTSKVSAA